MKFLILFAFSFNSFGTLSSKEQYQGFLESQMQREMGREIERIQRDANQVQKLVL